MRERVTLKEATHLKIVGIYYYALMHTNKNISIPVTRINLDLLAAVKVVMGSSSSSTVDITDPSYHYNCRYNYIQYIYIYNCNFNQNYS